MIDLELLKDSVMLLLCISNLLGMMGFYIPFVFLKDLAHTHGTDPSDSRYLVPIIGVTNTVGEYLLSFSSILTFSLLTEVLASRKGVLWMACRQRIRVGSCH